MENHKGFKIIQKHYDTLIKQGYDNLPYESGGFLGGKDGVICAIMPTFNKDWDENTDVFALQDGDIQRAYQFFSTHKLNYFGVYHTHPKGVAYPSEADIKTGHKYHFIISYRDKQNPQFNAFRVDNNVPIQIPLKIIPNTGFFSKNLKGGEDPEKIIEKKEVESLHNKVQSLIEGEKGIYNKLPPKEGELNSDFSTFA